MQESVTKDKSLTKDRYQHKAMPKLRNDNSHAWNRNGTKTEPY